MVWLRAVGNSLRGEIAEECVPVVFIAVVYIALGKWEKAFEWLEEAYGEHSVLMTMLKVDPLLDPARGMRAMG